MKKPLKLWTCFWGEKHLDLFEKALVRSLSWPLNKEALSHATWEIWTMEKDFSVVADIAKSVGIGITLNAADSFLADKDTKYLGDAGAMINQMFLVSAKKCLDAGAQMLIAPPDTIFGGDSIGNIIQSGEQDGSVVFVVHIRALPGIIDDIEVMGKTSVSGPMLVTLALANAHKSFVEAEFGKERINSFIGGIFWKRRPNGIISVNHRLPTPYLINWTQADYDYFNRPTPPGAWPAVFGELDHAWPAICIFPKERARVIGSSDDAFICEITDAEANVPPLMNYTHDEPDRFWRNAYHNQVQRQFCVTLRGE